VALLLLLLLLLLLPLLLLLLLLLLSLCLRSLVCLHRQVIYPAAYPFWTGWTTRQHMQQQQQMVQLQLLTAPQPSAGGSVRSLPHRE
jgi:hypothetical protein